MTITIEGTVGAAPSGSFGTVTLTTASTNDLICFIIFNEGPTLRTVSSVSGASLTFTKQAAYSGADPGRGGNNTSIELWTAPSTGTLTAATFTITMSGSFDDGGVIAFGVNGLADITNPFDSNADAIKTGTGGTEVISTTQADDIIIAAYASSSNNTPGGTPPTGFTNIDFANTAGGTYFASTGVSRKTVSATQSSVSITSGNGSTQLVDLVFCLTADTKIVNYDLSVSENVTVFDAVTATQPGTVQIEQSLAGYLRSGPVDLFNGVTSGFDNIIVLVYSVAGGGDGPAINTISSPTGFSTWTQRATNYNSAEDLHTEVWWASLTGSINTLYEVTFTGDLPTGGATILEMIVNGVNTFSPFDANASLPAISGGTSGTQSVSSVSTDTSTGLLFAVLSATSTYSQASSPPSGFTLLQFADTTIDPGADGTMGAGLSIKTFSAPLSGDTFTWGASGNGVMYVDALTSDSTILATSITEVMTAADTAFIPINLHVNEIMDGADSATRSLVFARTVSESGTAADTVRSGINLVVAEAGDLIDSAGQFTEGPTGTFHASLRDILNAVDTPGGGTLTAPASVHETMHATDLIGVGVNGVYSVSVHETGNLVDRTNESSRTNSTVQEIMSAIDHASGIVTTVGHSGTFDLSVQEMGNLVDLVGEAQTFTTPGLYFWNYLYAYPGIMSCWVAGLDCGDWPIAPDGSVFVPWRSDPDGLFTPAWLINLSNSPPENGFGASACNVDLTTNSGTILRVTVSAAIGLTYTSRVQLLAPNSPELTHSQFGPSFGTTRRLHQYAAKVVNAGQMSVGTDEGHLLPVQFRHPSGAKYPASQLFTGTHWDQVDDDYSYDGELIVEIERPYPATIVALGGFMKTNDRD